MSDKKHIDRLFQEGFKDFEATPNDAVWKQIEAELNQKKKKHRVIPIWWRYAGIAALLLLLLTVGGLLLNNSDDNPTNKVVDTENKSSKDIIDIKNSNPLNDTKNITPKVSNNTAQENLSNESDDKQSEIITNGNTNSSIETSVAETSASKNESKSKAASNKQLILSKKLINPNTNAIVNSSFEEENKLESKKVHTSSENSTQVANTSEKNSTLDKKTDSKNESPLINKEDVKSVINGTSKENTVIAKSDETRDNLTNSKEENKRSIEDAINNPEDFIEKENTQLNNRWSIAPNAAPVYFNTLGDGSSIDPQFNNNSKSGDVNMSYGISTSYAINKKISIRSGIHSVNLGYNTNDVAVFQNVGTRTLSSSALQNVSSTSSNVSLISTKSLESDASESIVASNASINQNLRYFEVPLEIQYKLSDKKLGVNVIGGFSSFFLNTSKVFYEEDNGNRTILGEANNINKVSYSANFGLGLNYKISKRFDLNLEPIFKYQFNTFNNTSGNFSPFLIGVYSGFAIKF